MKTRYIEGYVKLYVNTRIQDKQDARAALLDEFLDQFDSLYDSIDPGDTSPVVITYAGPLEEE